MKKKIAVLSVLIVICLVLGVAGSAQAGLKEVIVGSMYINFSEDSESSLSFMLNIQGTGNIISGDYLTISNNIPNAKVDEVGTAIDAFVTLAKSLGCTVGNVHVDGGEFESAYVVFIREGMRNRLISMLGELMKFPLTYELPN
jgi:hypothetical protein